MVKSTFTATAVALAGLAGQCVASFPDCVNGPMAKNVVCDHTKAPKERAEAFVKLLTLEEKVSLTGNTSPEIARLGIPKYEWWSEGLHGVAQGNPGITFAEAGEEFGHATSFPMPITMAAAFDDEIITKVAEVIALEARAFSNANRGGLDYWTPNVNPFRDPRWGRGQETPGEDPFHISSYVKALVAGLQGPATDPYKRVVATCKHFTGYDVENWFGNERYEFDAQISIQDLAEYHAPSFQACAREANVSAFMCTYNSVNGIPTCADPHLLDTILRKHWDWDQEERWVTSDCDSIETIFMPHHYTKDAEEAVAVAINAGVDVNCGAYYQMHLEGAIKRGLTNETILDRAIVRQYSSLVRLGYFDPPEMQPYRALNWSSVDTKASRDLAYKAAVGGIALLKNDGIFPLNLKNGTSVAIIGDWANATVQMQGNYLGRPPYHISPLEALEKVPGITVNYAFGCGGGPDPRTDEWKPAFDAAAKSDLIIYVGGVDNQQEAEGRDRMKIGWAAAQIDLITHLAALGKPMAIMQMGGGSLDAQWIKDDERIGGLMWGGYPGQFGGQALMDIATGKVSPSGRLTTTMYPASYVGQVSMLEMSMRPSRANPGRTYQWYTGTPAYTFGYGLSYTNFSAKIALNEKLTTFNTTDLAALCKNEKWLDLCPFSTLKVDITNEGSKFASDYSALAFISGEYGPFPRPKKMLVAYTRLHEVAPGETQSADLKLTLSSLSRVNEKGQRILYPGKFRVAIDTDPELAETTFELVGPEILLDEYPVDPNNKGGNKWKGGPPSFDPPQQEVMGSMDFWREKVMGGVVIVLIAITVVFAMRKRIFRKFL